MGYPLAVVLANIFMGFQETKWLYEIILTSLNFGDDILAAFGNDQVSSNFLIFLNNWHPTIKITIEKQINHSIPFLDVSLQLTIIKISHFKHITNSPIQDLHHAPIQFYIIFIKA